jgi:hypothetical protein
LAVGICEDEEKAVRKHEGEFGSPWPAGPERRRGRDGRFIVSCPACRGSGRVVRQDSQVPVGCRLCWERGRVARIVAERFERQRRAREADRADPDGPQDCPVVSTLL